MFQNWLKNSLMSQANSLMSNVTDGVSAIVTTVTSLLIGMIVSIYLLFSREIFVRQIKKCVYALLPARQANLVLHFSTKTNEILVAL